MFNFFNRSYYKTRIILSFSFVAIAIVIVASRISYVFTKDLYLNQVKEQVNLVVRLLGNQVDENYLRVLSLGPPVKSVQENFINLVGKNEIKDLVEESFIFNDNYVVFVHSDTSKETMQVEQRLFINRAELSMLDINESFTSLPFRGDDGIWYMWGFYNFNDHFYLAIRENTARLQKVEEFSLIFWYIGFGGVIATILLSWFIVSRITRPIEKLVTFSLEIGKGKFNIEVPDKIKGELKLLVDAMEAMKGDLTKNQQEKEKMLAQIAHEIRNPLGSIEILSGLVKEDLLKKNLSYDYIDKILSEVKELKETITSYLDLARPSQPNPEWCNLKDVYDDLSRMFTKQCNINNCKLELNGKGEKFWFDKSHLKIILANLVANSLECTDDNATIKITSSVNSDVYNISVEDNGHGISEEIKSKIFNPFFTTKADGTGLGLATSRKLCQENNAELFIEYSNNNGTKFTISKSVNNNG